MVTKQQALDAYNYLNNTTYSTVQELASDLVKDTLKTTWIKYQKNIAERNAKDAIIE